jgi:hypothetical protein
MIPRREGLNTIFNVWNSSVFPGRAPDGKILMTSFAGGAANPGFIEKDEAAIAQIVEREMGAVLGIAGSEIFGAGMAAAISTYTYHPHSERGFGNVADVWTTQMGWDAVTYMVKEFWPDLRRKHHDKPPQN